MNPCDGLVTSQVQLCLNKLLKKLNFQNFVISISRGSNKGDNFVGLIAKVKVEGKDTKGNHIVRNFIIKSAPRNEIFREVAFIESTFKREIYIYKKVLYEFELLQKEMNVKKPFKSYPKYYDSSIESMNEALIMEDLKEKGFELHQRYRSLNYDHVLMILREYGKLHALSFAMRLHKPDLFRELAENTQDILFTTEKNDEVLESFRVQGKRVLQSLDPVTEDILYKNFNKFESHMTDLVKSLFRTDLSNQYGVISHGDCWINNFLFKYDNSEEPGALLDMRILDWQISHCGSPALDLGYLIFAGTDKELRDEHYNFFIQEYYNTFSRFLIEMGGDPQTQFSFETLQKHLKKYSVFGLYMGLVCLLFMTSDNEELPNIQDITKVDDLVEKFKYDSKNVDEYNRKIKGIMSDFERLGYDF